MEFYSKKVEITIETIKNNIHEDVEDLMPVQYVEWGYKETGSPLPVADGSWSGLYPATRIGGSDKHYWIHKKFKTPKAVEGKELVLFLSTATQTPWAALNPQGLLYLNGKLIEGLDTNHTSCRLEYDTEYDMYIYLYSGYEEALFDFRAKLATADPVIERIYYDMSVPYNAALCFEKNDGHYLNIMKHLDIASNLLDLRIEKSPAYYESISKALDYLQTEFYEKACGRGNITVSCIGHTHIDVAWLWTYAQTREKVQRSFATVLQLMDRYPEYKFMSSQAQLYKYVKEEAPDLYEGIRKRIQEGRWEVEGAMWVEADCNLSSGESLVRQIMHGKRFFKEEFDKDSTILWLPDVFGYSAALPQILKKCGIEKFVTSKISWNEFNKLPVDAFMWRGIDGTEIFSYFLTCQENKKPHEDDMQTTYNGCLEPSYVLGTWKRFQQKEFCEETLLTYGYGDGGGGPTADMLEQQRRLSCGIPGIPKTRQSTVRDFFDKLEAEFYNGCIKLNRTPKWVGELYLEKHRGTYTTMGKNKYNNRRSELLYQTLEALSVFDMVFIGSEYPQDRINKEWEKILLNQFHDVIPGTSRYEVYCDTDRLYSEILDTGYGIVDSKLDNISRCISSDGGLLVYNPNSFEASGVLEYNGQAIFADKVPALGWKVFDEATIVKQGAASIAVSKEAIENNSFRVVLDEKGHITSIFDKRYDREVLCGGKLEIAAFEDRPYCWDAWDVSPYIMEKKYVIEDVKEIRVIDEGVRAGLEITRKFLNSTITQRIYLYTHIDRIDFDTTVDWQEKHILLKAVFPVNVNTDKVTYEIQFGNIERPSHENTSWDRARFETCAHKWADISDGGYGVSILNDCKYGHSAQGNVLMLSLLRGAVFPSKDADVGVHTFKYSMIPHIGDYRAAKTVQSAYLFNNPLLVRKLEKHTGKLPAEFSAVECSSGNVIIETIKKAEDGNDIIIRMYDAHNVRGKVKIKFAFGFRKAYVCDMLENNVYVLEASDNTVMVEIDNFEVMTLRLCI